MKSVSNPDTLQLLSQTGRFLSEKGIQSYLVGGLVRDMLLERDTADIDIAVAADALEIAPGLASALGGKYITLDEVNGVGRVVLPGGKGEIDASTLKGGIDHDLAQRDFTIDAMAIEMDDLIPELSLNADRIIDPFHGRDDLKQGVIRAVSETALHADPVRLLRAVRLAAELNFTIEPETEIHIKHHHKLVAGIASERVREELLRILNIPGAGQRLAYLDELGLLTAVIPELVPSRGVDQPLIHFWDVFAHSLKTVNAVEFVLREGTWEYADKDALASVPWPADLERHFNQTVGHGSTRKSLLKLAALLHDIAKPQTKTVDEDGRARFLGHPQEGSATAASVLERLRFSHKEMKMVALMIENHLRPTQMSHEGLPTHRAIYRYFRDTGETGLDILFLSLADHLATRGPHLDRAQWQEHARLVAYVITKKSEEKKLVAPPRLIDGHDLINIFQLPPCAKIGELLETVREAQASGEINTRQEALEFVRRLLADSTPA